MPTPHPELFRFARICARLRPPAEWLARAAEVAGVSGTDHPPTRFPSPCPRPNAVGSTMSSSPASNACLATKRQPTSEPGRPHIEQVHACSARVLAQPGRAGARVTAARLGARSTPTAPGRVIGIPAPRLLKLSVLPLADYRFRRCRSDGSPAARHGRSLLPYPRTRWMQVAARHPRAAAGLGQVRRKATRWLPDCRCENLSALPPPRCRSTLNRGLREASVGRLPPIRPAEHPGVLHPDAWRALPARRSLGLPAPFLTGCSTGVPAAAATSAMSPKLAAAAECRIAATGWSWLKTIASSARPNPYCGTGRQPTSSR